MKKIVFFLVVFSFIGLSVNATVRYVKPGGFPGFGGIIIGGGDGSSWANASNDLQEMINQSRAGDEIWVAAGTYVSHRVVNEINGFPALGPDNTFLLKKDVKIYGGFSGNETSLSARNPSIYTTTLSGIVSVMSFPNFVKSFHVVTSLGDVGTACLDGFTIENGLASGTGYNIVTVDGYSYSLPNNSGGGICLINSSPTLKNLKIINNEASDGGGIYAIGSNSAITNVLIQNNTAYEGGGIYLVASPNTLTLTNIEISNNIASYGGGICNAACSLTLVNATIVGNDGYFSGGGIYNYMGTATIRNSIIYGNIGTGNTSGILESDCSYSLVNGVTTTMNNNINGSTNPRFVSVSTHNYRLSTSPILSPCIGAGRNNYNTTYYDLAGNNRIRGNNIDMGAYESDNGTKSFSGQDENSFENEANPEIALRVFPNPATEQLNINSSIPFAKVSLINVLGQTIKEVEVGAENHVLNVSDVAKGLYILKVDTPQGSTTKKIQIK